MLFEDVASSVVTIVATALPGSVLARVAGYFYQHDH